MTVRAALVVINQVLDEVLSSSDADLDSDTRFCVTWFEQFGMTEGKFGDADNIARARNTSVDGLVEAGVLASRAGRVRLLQREDMANDWDPISDRRPTAWEAAQHLTKRLANGGEDAAADLLRRLGGGYGEQARELAYRLYSICERKGWAQEALPYNALVVAWPEIARRVAGTPEAEAQQALEV
jgi:putative DNA methylase